MTRLVCGLLLLFTPGCYNVWGRADILKPHDCDIITDASHFEMVKSVAEKWEAVGCFTISVSVGNPTNMPHNIYFVDAIEDSDGSNSSMSVWDDMDSRYTEATIMHEMGHHQGLIHTQDEHDVMYRHNPNTVLTDNDINQVRSVCRANGFEM